MYGKLYKKYPRTLGLHLILILSFWHEKKLQELELNMKLYQNWDG